jgi:asparagine N-glycosylation enzyme membrane subunit Stt3
MTHVVRDVFTPANGYPAGLEVDGLPLLDQVCFAIDL